MSAAQQISIIGRSHFFSQTLREVWKLKRLVRLGWQEIHALYEQGERMRVRVRTELR